jgi:thioredoxin-dependent peroxiredoxin
MLKVGDKAPEFRLKADDGKDVSLADFRGKRVLLFYFPKANTSG